MTSFTDLVDDVILLLPQHIATEQDLASLSCASRRLHSLLDPVLYARHVRFHRGKALNWAAKNDMVETARKLLAAGADPMVHAVKDLPREDSDSEGDSETKGDGDSGVDGDAEENSNVESSSDAEHDEDNDSDTSYGEDYRSRVPLTYAAERGSVGVTKLLLKAEGVDPNWHCYDIPPPIVCAARHGHADVVALYLADPRTDPQLRDSDDMSALSHAADKAYPRIAELMLRDGRADPNATCRFEVSALEFASMCSQPNAECLAMLQADPRVDAHAADHEGRTALHVAAGHGHTENVQWLLDAGLDPNSQDEKGKTPLAHAAEFNAFAHTARFNARAHTAGFNARAHAAECNALANIDALLGAPGVDPNACGHDRRTPLMCAMMWRKVEAAERLVADPRVLPDLAPRNGTTPLMVACRDGMTGAVKALLARPDLDLSLRDSGGRTALHMALMKGRYHIVGLLRKRGRLADMAVASDPHPIHEMSKRGRNAMSFAAQCGPEWVVEFLLEIEREVEGVDWMREDVSGHDPVWYARHHNRPRIADLLEEEWSKRERRPSASWAEDSSCSPS